MTSFAFHSTILACVMLLLAPAARAQGGLCGGIGETGQWIGGSEAASDIAIADNYREQMALVLTGNAYVALFSLSNAADVRLEAAGRGDGDPVMTLLDAEGGTVLTDDDSGGGAAARAETSLDAGTYCLQMESYGAAPMAAFVRISRIEQEALTPGLDTGGGDAPGAMVPPASADDDPASIAEGCAAAVDLGVFDAPLGATGSADDVPYWRFTLDAAQAISVTAENEAADPVLALYDASGALLAENDDYNGLNARIDMATALAAGEYCAALSALADSSQPITVAVTTYDAGAALAGLYARGEAAPPLDGSVPITALGPLPGRLRHDVQVGSDAAWFSLQIDAPGLLLVEAIAVGGGDPWLAIYDDLGRQMALNDDDGDSLDARVSTRVLPGTYLVATRQADGGQGFVRLLFERFLPAP